MIHTNPWYVESPKDKYQIEDNATTDEAESKHIGKSILCQ